MSIFIGLICLLCCGYGFILIFAKNSAWSYVAWRNRNAGLASERTNQWNASATFQGIVLIAIGIGMLFFIPHSTNSPSLSTPQPGQTTVGIEGHTLTSQEQEELQQEFKGGAFKSGNSSSSSPGH
jgi:hypothetical protein